MRSGNRNGRWFDNGNNCETRTAIYDDGSNDMRSWPYLIRVGVLTGLMLSISLQQADATAWPVHRSWSENEEEGYSRWVVIVGSSQWKSLNQMLHSRANPLRDEADRDLRFYADCADLPYMLRAYYAYKRGLPMVVNVVGGGRYSGRNRTASTIDNLSFEGNAQAFFRAIPHMVHSGNFRTAPDAEDSFTYPLAISPAFIRPGVIFYNPNGHIAVVSGIDGDGTVRMLDAHPDQTITNIVLGPKMAWRSASEVGGFKGIRPCARVGQGDLTLSKDNRLLRGFSVEQYTFGLRYHLEVQRRLATVRIDPIADFEKYIREDTYREVLDRVASVERGWEIGRRRAIPVPPNIYYATGDWEDFATPGRDIRLRLSFLHIPERAKNYVEMFRHHRESLAGGYQSERKLAADLLRTKERLFKQLRFIYRDRGGAEVSLSLAELEPRLFRLSFDPNHSPELRWGSGGGEPAEHAVRRWIRAAATVA
jgi:hypothetical protein